VTVVHCTYDPATKGGNYPERKVKGTIHWISAATAVKAEVRLYENLIDEEKGVYNEEDGSMNINPDSLTVLGDCYVEPDLGKASPEDRFQFVRTGYFCVDSKDSSPEHLVFNRIVSLKSSFKL
jgi:glutaminyl-tRNA synthetase